MCDINYLLIVSSLHIFSALLQTGRHSRVRTAVQRTLIARDLSVTAPRLITTSVDLWSVFAACYLLEIVTSA